VDGNVSAYRKRSSLGSNMNVHAISDLEQNVEAVTKLEQK